MSSLDLNYRHWLLSQPSFFNRKPEQINQQTNNGSCNVKTYIRQKAKTIGQQYLEFIATFYYNALVLIFAQRMH